MKYLHYSLLLIISAIIIPNGIAQTVSHPAEEILPGTFASGGSFTFSESLEVIGNIMIKTTTLNSLLNIDSIGSFSGIDFYDNGQNKWGVGKNPSNEFYISEFGLGDRIIIIPGGNVGIGNPNPTFKLDVVGDVRWTGTLQGGSVPWERLIAIPAGFADNVDNVGITSETDPTVLASVKNGVSWGEIGSKPAGFADNVDNVGITSESDPQVGAVTSGQWCRGDGSAVQCNQAAPVGGAPYLRTCSWGSGTNSCIVNCDAGDKATGGGFSAPGDFVMHSLPWPPGTLNGWLCDLGSGFISGTCYVICADLTP